MDSYLILLHTPSFKFYEIPQPSVTRQISTKEEVIKLMWSAVEGKESEEKWVRENLLRPDLWPCILVGWRRDRDLFCQERGPKGTTTILYPEESPGEFQREVKEDFMRTDPHFGIARSDVGRLDITHSHVRIDVYLRREEENRPLVAFSLILDEFSLKLKSLLWRENAVLPVEKHVSLSHYCGGIFGPSFIRAAVGEITEIIPRGVVMLAGKPCENHLVYVCAEPEPLLHHLSQLRR